MKYPLVSVIMNCYNGENYLEEALESIFKQTITNWNLIFWDNCSTDKSKDIVDSFRSEKIKYFKSNKTTSLGLARKNALRECDGEIVAFLDTDDVRMPNKLECQIPILLADSENGICISNTIFFSRKKERKLYTKPPPQGYVTNDLLNKYFISLETVVLKMEKIRNLDQDFSERYSHISDFDLLLRISAISKLTYCDKVLSKWRIHNNNR